MQVSEIFATREAFWDTFVDATAAPDAEGVAGVLVGHAIVALLKEQRGTTIKDRLFGYPTMHFYGDAVHIVSLYGGTITTVRLRPVDDSDHEGDAA